MERKSPLAFVAVAVIAVRAVSQCVFPKDWRGSWFENNLGEIMISATSVTRKGSCRDSMNGYFLLLNEEMHCHVCILMEPRHINLIQYKESFCVSESSLDAVCANINLDGLQHTLIRGSSSPVACPFHEAYHFSYSNNSGGLCSNPTSYVKPCASPAQFRFHFRHCSDASYTYSRDVDLECLATWREGADNYFFGRLFGKDIDTNSDAKNSKYRCFMYRVWGTVVYISSSADASCRGLRSTRNGPVVMEFTQDVFGWPRSQCTYPAWITRNTWRDLSGRFLYQPNDMGDVIQLNFRQTLTSQPEVNKSFRCYRLLGQNTTTSQSVAVSFLLAGCSSKYQCIKFVKRKDGVLEIHEGRFMDYAEGHCSEEDILESNKRLIFADTVHGRTCPFEGRHVILGLQSQASACATYFRSGCNGSSTIEFKNSCSTKPDLQLECLKSWKENKKVYLIARTKADEHTGTASCFSFRKRGGNIEFSSEPTCGVGTSASATSSSTVSDRIMYVMEQQGVACELIQPHHLPTVNAASSSAAAADAGPDDVIDDDVIDDITPDDSGTVFNSWGPYRIAPNKKNTDPRTPPKNVSFKASKASISQHAADMGGFLLRIFIIVSVVIKF